MQKPMAILRQEPAYYYAHDSIKTFGYSLILKYFNYNYYLNSIILRYVRKKMPKKKIKKNY
jgi:hypothetical protein